MEQDIYVDYVSIDEIPENILISERLETNR